MIKQNKKWIGRSRALNRTLSPERSMSFTLIELLLVIAIIATLAALLSPALKKARDSARGIQCLNNLRQVSLALQNYASDNRDTFPGFYVNDSNGNPIHWQQLIISNYLAEADSSPWTSPSLSDVLHSPLHCPSDRGVYPPWNRPVRSIALNANDNSHLYGVSMRNLGDIRIPAELCLVCDGAGGDTPTTEWGYASRTTGIGSGLFPDSVYFRHNGGMYAVMVDGHGAWYSMSWVQNERANAWTTSHFFDWNEQY